MNLEDPPRSLPVVSFRLKLFAAIMIVVAAVTALTLYLAEQNAQEEVGRNVEREFRDALTALHEAREVRLTLLAERCRSLAKAVRIRAALEESSAEDLYTNAEIELRGILAGEPEPEPEAAGRTLRAKFFRFLDAQGTVITPGKIVGSGRADGALEAKLGMQGVSNRQEIGYLMVKSENGEETPCEIIATPIVATDTHEVIGAVVIGFPPLELTGPPGMEGLKSGIWVEGRLHLPALSPAAQGFGGAALARVVEQPERAERSLPVQIEGAPHLLLYQRLNPGSRFAAAFEVCLFPLTGSLARQRRFRIQILSAAALLLAGGLAVSHFISGRFSAPVAKLAEDSAANRAQRERAESALEITNQKLSSRNAELQQALADLKATQQHVIQQERLSALGQMASGIAHDFNNALVPILGFSQLLQLDPELLADTERTTRYLGVIQTAAQDAANVVGRLHQFYRVRDENESFAAVDLNRIAQQAIELTQPRWKDQAQSSGSTVEVVAELADLPPVAGDESALREALTNLIFNAVDALPNGGRITIRTRRAGVSAQIEVEDNGTGMSEEVRLRCLEPFYSTKGQRGTGLGLAMVFGMAQRHRGSLQVESELGKGTTFILTLPLHRANDLAIDEVSGVTRSRSLRILVVDDEPNVRELLSAALSADGHEVATAALGEEAFQRFKAGHFDLVVTDKAMPGMSGDQLAALIKKHSPPTPIILLTGFGQFLEKENIPFVDVLIAKPIDLLALRQAVATAHQGV